MKFITKDDIWGIRIAVRQLWNKPDKGGSYWNGSFHSGGDKEIEFNAFYNQQLPEAWRASLATVKRHADEIIAQASNPQYRGLVWFERNGQFNSGFLNHQLINEIKQKEITLPTYIEIEEEKQRWQAHPNYDPARGKSEPIREELIQLRIHK